MKHLDIIIVILAIILCAVLLVTNLTGAILETGNWGLSFQVEGEPPAGPASASDL